MQTQILNKKQSIWSKNKKKRNKYEYIFGPNYLNIFKYRIIRSPMFTESFFALSTFVWFLSSVSQQVFLQIFS